MKYKVKNFYGSVDLEGYLNTNQISKSSILFVGPTKDGYTLIYVM